MGGLRIHKNQYPSLHEIGCIYDTGFTYWSSRARMLSPEKIQGGMTKIVNISVENIEGMCNKGDISLKDMTVE